MSIRGCCGSHGQPGKNIKPVFTTINKIAIALAVIAVIGLALAAFGASRLIMGNVGVFSPVGVFSQIDQLAAYLMVGIGGGTALISFIAIAVLKIKAASTATPSALSSLIPPPTAVPVATPQELLQDCQDTKKQVFAKIEKDLDSNDGQLLEKAANRALEAAKECSDGVTDTVVLDLIRTGFIAELKNLALVAEALKEGKRTESIVSTFLLCSQLQTLLSSLRVTAIEARHVSEFESILDQLGDVNASLNQMGDTPLMFLAKYGQPVEFVDILLKKGANFDYKETHFGNTALIWAIANANNEMALKIIQKGRQNVDLHSMGNTALTLAISKGYTTHSCDGKELKVSNLQLVQALLDKKADPNLKNPLQIAIIRRNPDMISAL